ncbi:MAG: repair protein RecO [Patescibacteria group bacterium]|jgi:DNA repair protein RecO|nr:repair protein RecO [Patescibacteria group bacterium]
MKYYELNSYILARKNVFEADKIITLFSYEMGKSQAIAKGVRLSKAKLAGNLEPFNKCKLRLVKGRNLDIIVGVEPGKMHDYSRLTAERLQVLYLISEILSRLSADHQPNTVAFDLFEESIDALIGSIDPVLIAQYFGLNFLQSIGSQPELIDTKQHSRHYLAYDSGKITMLKPNSHYGIISEPTIKLWRLIVAHNITYIQKITNLQKALEEGYKLMLHYYEYHFDFQPKSLKVFQD